MSRINKETKNSQKGKAIEDVENTIFVGNLPKLIEIKELKKLFRKFGTITSIRLRGATRTQLNTSKRLAVIKKEFHEDSQHINAYIKFETSGSCTDALKMNGFLLQEHHLRVNLASERKTDSRKSVFVGNLPFKVQDDDLWEVFEDCGTVENVRVIRDEKTGIGKGFGYINFKTTDAVELALQLNGVTILDRNIRVTRAVDDRKTLPRIKRIKSNQPKNSTKPKKRENPLESEEKGKSRNYFQGRRTKRGSVQKKNKKKKSFGKKHFIIKQIAEDISKKKNTTKSKIKQK